MGHITWFGCVSLPSFTGAALHCVWNTLYYLCPMHYTVHWDTHYICCSLVYCESSLNIVWESSLPFQLLSRIHARRSLIWLPNNWLVLIIYLVNALSCHGDYPFNWKDTAIVRNPHRVCNRVEIQRGLPSDHKTNLKESERKDNGIRLKVSQNSTVLFPPLLKVG